MNAEQRARLYALYQGVCTLCTGRQPKITDMSGTPEQIDQMLAEIKKLLHIDRTDAPLSFLEENYAEATARRKAKQDLEKLVEKRMARAEREYYDSLRLSLLDEMGGAETAATRRKLTDLVVKEGIALSASAFARARPVRADQLVGQEEAFSRLRSALCSPYPQHVLLYGGPGCGKTTYLRDTARLLSLRGYRCVLVDERGELGDFCEGAAGFDFGPGCDILSGCPKAAGIEMAIRSLNPQVILFDEIGGPQEAQAVSAGFCSGVQFVTTLHAGSPEELAVRPSAAPLLSSGAFGAAVFLPEVFAKPEIFVFGGERNAAGGCSDFVYNSDGGGVYEKHVS